MSAMMIMRQVGWGWGRGQARWVAELLPFMTSAHIRLSYEMLWWM